MDKKYGKGVWLFFLLTLGLICTSCGGKTDSPPIGNETAAAIETETVAVTETEMAAATEAELETKTEAEPASGGENSDSMSPLQAKFIYGSNFKAGDFKYRLLISHGQPDQPNTLWVTVQTRDLESDYRNWSNVMLTVQEFSFPYKSINGSVYLEDRSPLSFNLDGSITLQDGTEAAGDYYSFEESLIMPEAFLRPLNDTDLTGLTSDEMRLIRNEFYAVYGRRFQSSDLQYYFGSQLWYREMEPSEEFDDHILGGMVKRNAEFLKKAEENYNQDSASTLKQAYGKLPEVPYLNLLPDEGEIYISMESAPGAAEDCGIYYKARGTIGLPLTLTVDQNHELGDGHLIEIDAVSLMGIFPEWTDGPNMWLKKAVNSQYGGCVLLRTPDESEENGFYADAVYDSATGVYVLRHDSGDTIFKKVYEGDIYVLKGASEEYYRNFDVSGDDLGEAAGKFRIMDFNETDDLPYEGNIAVTDSKGYLKALYFYGD